MTRPGRRRNKNALSRRQPRDEASRAADAMRVESLSVAMAIAPGVYARNRMFAFFASWAVQRAKGRAATLRGIVKQLARASAITLDNESEATENEAPEIGIVLRYEIPTMQLSRIVELSRTELATVRMLASRAGLSCLPAGDGDRVLVESALARLLLAGGDNGTLARAAQDIANDGPAADVVS